jgi:hypothetical protein
VKIIKKAILWAQPIYPLTSELRMARKFIGTLFLTLSYQLSQGQVQNADTTGNILATAHATATFQQAVHFQKEIYSGAEHMGYAPSVEGSAYFSAKDWAPGAVLYDGVLYGSESLMYDQVKDKLVLKRFDGFPVELRSDKIIYFTLAGHTFIYINRKPSLRAERRLLRPPGCWRPYYTGTAYKNY